MLNIPEYASSSVVQLPEAPTTETGTISSSGKQVTGTSTLFLSELEEGGWLYHDADLEFIEIDKIFSNTLLTLKHAPATAFSADAVSYVRPIRCANFSVSNTGTANATIYFRNAAGVWDSSIVKAGLNRFFGIDAAIARSEHKIPKPMVVDGTGTTISTNVTY